MRKEYKLKVSTKKKKLFIYLFFFLCGLFLSFKYINSLNINYKNKRLTEFLLDKATYKKGYTKTLIKNTFLDIYKNPTKYLLNINTKVKNEQEIIIPATNLDNSNKPLIYIYNTHQTEEYASSNILEFTIKPTVTMANYILEDIFNSNSYKTLVEERNIKEILNQNNWKYSNSYKASRIFLESSKKENPTLKYFIDVHRDSLKKERTTITINDKSYAKLLFIVGLENKTYNDNLMFTTEINNCLNTKYPNLSKGIYKKSGPGVNGIYNQDFSPYTILIEIGGYENTTTEVLNSSIAFSECFMEVISIYESSRNN